jgi:16S rRNA processing protein RimM
MLLNPDRMSGKQERPAGSLRTGEPALLAAGKIHRPHGVHGEVFVELYTDFPEQLQPQKIVFLGEKHEPATICSQRSHKDGLLLGFDGYLTPETVSIFRNKILYVSASESPELPDGEYYFHELLDLSVMDETGNRLGKLTEIIETGANDVYVVTTTSGAEILLPSIPEVVKAVDLEARTLTVHLLPGLLDAEEEES